MCFPTTLTIPNNLNRQYSDTHRPNLPLQSNHAFSATTVYMSIRLPTEPNQPPKSLDASLILTFDLRLTQISSTSGINPLTAIAQNTLRTVLIAFPVGIPFISFCQHIYGYHSQRTTLPFIDTESAALNTDGQVKQSCKILHTRRDVQRQVITLISDTHRNVKAHPWVAHDKLREVKTLCVEHTTPFYPLMRVNKEVSAYNLGL